MLATDVDEATAAIATVNLRHFPDAEVRHGDGLALDLEGEGVDGVYADPARRTSSGSRVFDPSAYEPALDRVLELRERVPALGLKLGPGIPHSALPLDAHAQWVSVDGDVVELGPVVRAARARGLRTVRARAAGRAGAHDPGAATRTASTGRRPVRSVPTCTSPTAPSSARGWWASWPTRCAGGWWTRPSPT